MALDSESASGSELSSLWDPFVEKAELADIRREDWLHKYQELNVNGGSDLRDTSMVYLVLKCNLILSDAQYMGILGLDPNVRPHYDLYTLVLADVRYLAGHLKGEVMAHSLIQMPLTDIRQLCYRVADKYESLFFVPVPGSDGEAENASSNGFAVWFQWLDRYNCMWPIVSMLNREYQKIPSY